MKPILSSLLPAALAVLGLSSCCSFPPLLCCSCSDAHYRPLGRPTTPGDTYSAGYLCGRHDARAGLSQNWPKHAEEIGGRVQEEYFVRGYQDGYAGKANHECGTMTMAELTTHERH